MLNYRQIFYQNYYSSQLGRQAADYSKKLIDEAKQFEFEILPLLKADKNAQIVDLGCGIGSLVWLLQQEGFENASGIDVSEEMVNVAAKLNIRNITKEDLIPFLKSKKGHFDVILGMDIIEHFTKDELIELLQLSKDALKEGGQAIFRTPNMDAPFGSIFSSGDFTHENYLNSSSAKQVMMNLGFKNIKVRPSLMRVSGVIKELLRRILWFFILIYIKLILFATGRSSSNLVLSPNLIIQVEK